jgi:Type II CAAX prenyl endopeptidase Rce1-like
VAQTTVLAAIATAFGMWLGPPVGLGALVRRSNASRGRRLALAALGGICVGALILALEAVLFAPLLPTDLSAEAAQRVAPWMGALASVYGAVDEEVLLRLGVMTLLAWALSHVGRRRTEMADSLMWVSVVGAALLFGAGHLPATAALTPLTPIVMIRTIALSGLGGVLYGWLYWRQGLALAMVAHGGTDLVLHVLAPILVGRAYGGDEYDRRDSETRSSGRG